MTQLSVFHAISHVATKNASHLLYPNAYIYLAKACPCSTACIFLQVQLIALIAFFPRLQINEVILKTFTLF